MDMFDYHHYLYLLTYLSTVYLPHRQDPEEHYRLAINVLDNIVQNTQ